MTDFSFDDDEEVPYVPPSQELTVEKAFEPGSEAEFAEQLGACEAEAEHLDAMEAVRDERLVLSAPEEPFADPFFNSVSKRKRDLGMDTNSRLTKKQRAVRKARNKRAKQGRRNARRRR